MGHERVGALPLTKTWRDLVAQIATLPTPDGDVGRLADTTLQNVTAQLRRIQRDSGVRAAFEFLVALSARDPSSIPGRGPEVPELSSNPSPLRLVVALREWVSANSESLEYASLAERAAADTIALWTKQRQQQPSLFEQRVSAEQVWESARSGAGFCEVARLFFSKFTERYLNYFLGREASAELSNVEERDRLADGLREHVESVSKFDSLVKTRFEEVPAI